ncbi:MAG: hypothetical protein NC079_09125 [Clostridium sp.]|nr:hypothetical protein [Acetatifactor muris]MCM1527510.1 hypothetical protein [Bacteroides sp.]MCM1563752.1 hypothetical protein [Clostridium sp.]
MERIGGGLLVHHVFIVNGECEWYDQESKFIMNRKRNRTSKGIKRVVETRQSRREKESRNGEEDVVE